MAVAVSISCLRGLVVTAESQSQNPNRSNSLNSQNHFPTFFTPITTLSHRRSLLPKCKESSDTHPHREQGVKAALSMLKFYKREISPLLPKSCRYVPTCSEYSMEAYKKYGVVKGTVLTACRLCRCNPLGGSGFDPPRWFDEKSLPEE
ncbi:hypothetical protein FNV43_RR09905 [Rhamnella rubrinervis]|uniref:Uncharacterized protein n=1 Tax=Rhamnella rubrinervis TaxID=2594499 RepID=A0A8K0HAT9_9ROSA|nr:hypothetical protein FNV43_RR09905 [Rhamnella rubrinervis]